jgi:hypothetical protein
MAQMFRVLRPITMQGVQFRRGDVVDLEPLGLPSGRAMQLVIQRRGEFVDGVEATVSPDLSVAETVEVSDPVTVVPEPEPADVVGEGDWSIPVEAPTAQGVVEANGWEYMSKDELVAEARLRGLPVRKNAARAKLIQRLKDEVDPPF